MKVNIENVEKRTGLFRKRLYGVKTTVAFTEEEIAIIKERNLFRSVVMEREWGADINPYSKYKRTWTALIVRTAKALVYGTHANTPDLCVDGLMRGADTYYMSNTSEAKGYIDLLRDKLKELKAVIEDSAETASNEAFESYSHLLVMALLRRHLGWCQDLLACSLRRL